MMMTYPPAALEGKWNCLGSLETLCVSMGSFLCWSELSLLGLLTINLTSFSGALS